MTSLLSEQSLLKAGMCQKCVDIAHKQIMRTLPFLFSEHDAQSDELAQVKVVVARQRA